MVIIGVDQSYTDSGLAVAKNNKIKYISNLKNKGFSCKAEYRAALKEKLRKIILKIYKHYGTDIKIIVERTRLYSTPSKTGSNKAFISMAYIKSSATLIAAVCDVAYEYGIDVYSVDTGAWKARILGSKKSAGDKKRTSISFVCRLGFADCITEIVTKGKNKGRKRFNDNMADAVCMSLYGFLPEKVQKLKLES